MKQCKKMLKPDGYLLITDFSYYQTPADQTYGYRTSTVGSEMPKDFEAFNFIIDEIPGFDYKIFQIPSHVMFRAGRMGGFNKIDFTD